MSKSLLRSASWLLLLAIVTVLVIAMDPIGRFIYFPDDYLVATPADLGMEYEDVVLDVGGETTHGWLVPGTGDQTLLWFHGNAGNISHRLDNLRLLHDRVGVSILIVDYGGYGRSTGSPSEARMFADARATLDFVLERGVDRSQIVYFGRSLGSGVALDLAVGEPPAKLILETPFESIRAMAAALFPRPLAKLIPQQFDNLSKIGRIRCPVLFIHGDRDEIVPFAHGQSLFAAAPQPKQFFRIPGATHNDTYIVGGAEYFETIRRFLAESS